MLENEKKQPKKRKKETHQTNPQEPKPTSTKNPNPTHKEHTRNLPGTYTLKHNTRSPQATHKLQNLSLSSPTPRMHTHKMKMVVVKYCCFKLEIIAGQSM